MTSHNYTTSDSTHEPLTQITTNMPTVKSTTSTATATPVQIDSSNMHRRNESLSTLLSISAAEKTASLIQLLDANNIDIHSIPPPPLVERPFSTRANSINRFNNPRLISSASVQPFKPTTSATYHKKKTSLSNDSASGMVHLLPSPVPTTAEMKIEMNAATNENTSNKPNADMAYPNKRRNSESLDEHENGYETSVVIKDSNITSPYPQRTQSDPTDSEVQSNNGKEKKISGLNEFITTYNDHIVGGENGKTNDRDKDGKDNSVNGNDHYQDGVGKLKLAREVSNEIDKKSIAIKAAQEFMAMVAENDALNRENEVLHMDLEDLKTQLAELTEEMQKHNHHSRHNSNLEADLQQLQMENETLQSQIKMLQERLNEEQESLNNSPPANHVQTSSTVITVLKTDQLQKQDLLEQALQKMEEEMHQKEQLQHELEELRKKYQELEHKTATNENEIKVLSGELQQMHEDREEFENAFEADLQEVEEVQDAVVQAQEEQIELMQRMRGMTLEKARVQEKADLFEQKMKEQQTIIEALHLEKDELETQLKEMQTNKLARDDEMFSLLRDLQSNNDGNKTVEPQAEMSRTSLADDDGFTFALGHSYGMTEIMSYRTQRVLNDEPEPQQLDLVVEEPIPSDAPTTAVTSSNEIDATVPDPNALKKTKSRAQKQEELAKAAAELEFFYLTCIAVKTNLSEEFPELEEQIQLNESPVELYKIAQVQAIEMSKFSIWVESRIRQKYGLPELKRSRKFKMPKIVFRRPSLHLREKLQHLLFQETPRKLTQSMTNAKEYIKSSVTRSATMPEDNPNDAKLNVSENDVVVSSLSLPMPDPRVNSVNTGVKSASIQSKDVHSTLSSDNPDQESKNEADLNTHQPDSNNNATTTNNTNADSEKSQKDEKANTQSETGTTEEKNNTEDQANSGGGCANCAIL